MPPASKKSPMLCLNKAWSCKKTKSNSKPNNPFFVYKNVTTSKTIFFFFEGGIGPRPKGTQSTPKKNKIKENDFKLTITTSRKKLNLISKKKFNFKNFIKNK